jgi:hypothetical protein
MTREEELERAEIAKQVLDNPLVQEALQAIREVTHTKLRMAKDDNDKLQLLDFLHAAELFEEYFVKHIETGKLAQIQVSKEDTLMQRLRRII